MGLEYFDKMGLGRLYVWLEEYDSAFYWLEKAYKNRSAEMFKLKADKTKMDN